MLFDVSEIGDVDNTYKGLVLCFNQFSNDKNFQVRCTVFSYLAETILQWNIQTDCPLENEKVRMKRSNKAILEVREIPQS